MQGKNIYKKNSSGKSFAILFLWQNEQACTLTQWIQIRSDSGTCFDLKNLSKIYFIKIK